MTARQNDVVVANGVGKEIGGLGRIVETDDQLGTAEVGLSLTAQQLPFGDEGAA